MPTPFVTRAASLCGFPVSRSEKLWHDAKRIAVERGVPESDPDFYAYVMGIYKNSLGADCENQLAAADEAATPMSRAAALLTEAFGKGPKAKPPVKKVPAASHADDEGGDEELGDEELDGSEEESPEGEEAAPTPSKSAPASPKADPKEELLARDLGELYQDVLARWDAVNGRPTPTEWSADNPYHTELTQAVREVLQAGAVLHYEGLEHLRAAALNAMAGWPLTNPQLLPELSAGMRKLPAMHRQALLPIVQELISRRLLPDDTIFTIVGYQLDPSRWKDAFPTLMAANAARTVMPATGTPAAVGTAGADALAGVVIDVVAETLVECLLYNT